MTRLSHEEKMRICILREQGKSWKEICNETNVKRSTARSIMKKKLETGSINNKKSKWTTAKIFWKSVMFWGSISIKGLCSLLECSDKMNANEYISVLDHAVIHTLPQFNQTIQQDNAPIHKAASVMAWLKDYDDVIEWPPNSPDLNIMENVWLIIIKKSAKNVPQ